MPRSNTFSSPFGSAVLERSWSDNTREYRFGFNTQEKDNELAGEGNSYTAEYWQYDSRLGRRFNLDPIIKKYESPYACLSNNPIWIIDIKGSDTQFVDNQARVDFIGTMNELDNGIEKVNSKIAKIKEEAKTKGWSDKKLDRKLNKSGFIEELNGLKRLRNNFNTIIKSKVIFRYSTTLGIGGLKKNQNGETTPNPDGQSVFVVFRPGYRESVIHENRHCIGILLHELGPNNDGYDLQDELNAFEDQALYSPESIYELIESISTTQYPDNPDRRVGYTLKDAILYLYRNSKAIKEFSGKMATNSPFPHITPP